MRKYEYLIRPQSYARGERSLWYFIPVTLSHRKQSF